MSVWSLPVAVALFGELFEDFCFLIERLYGAMGSGGVILRNIVVDAAQPTFGLDCPGQLPHVLMRRPISS